MPDTYTDAVTDLNWLRELLGETVVGTAWSVTAYDGHMFSDTRIQNLIDEMGTVAAGASLAEAKASRYAALVGKFTSDGTSEDITTTVEYFRDLAKRFRSGALIPPGDAAAGGVAVLAMTLPDLTDYRTD